MNVGVRSGRRGRSTSAPEVTNISRNGIWVLVDEREYFLSFEEFPWFENATVKEIHAVTRPAKGRVRWRALDVDLALDSLARPADFPLVARDRPVRRGAKRFTGAVSPAKKSRRK
ncbi:MAG TPA: DUF2442 domain-containing protein [Candidatus Eisenbacteria bacterium]|nr:DUF2442 domain-containing protein [Candidatus Eisenbacteria bacterium]